MKPHPKNLLWDLGNTLLKIDVMTFIKQVGFKDLILYPLLDQEHPKQVLKKTIDLLQHIDSQEYTHCLATALGNPLPPVACQWLAGELEQKNVLDFLETPIMHRVPKNFFKSEREARIIQKLLRLLTDPKLLASSVSIIEEGITLLKECAAQCDEQGNQLHTLYVLSNWDPYSFEHLINELHLKELFDCFERSNIIISGRIGTLKPHDAIYSYVLSTYALNPSDCILIDDQEENIHGAQKNGMHGILIKNSNYRHVRKQLQKCNVLPRSR